MYIGCRCAEQGVVLKKLFHSQTFQIRVISDVVTVELCGALKVSMLYLHYVYQVSCTLCLCVCERERMREL